MKYKEIVIAKDFSDCPFGRYKSDSNFSAQAFSEDYLIPALKNYDVVTVVLDGVFGYGSSFLEEAFGGLLRYGFSSIDLKTKLNIVSEEDEHLVTEILRYINGKG
ncbi:TPA: STAS-like domain-containing protein [Enterobacter hormaechei subsp. xiangfangensis]|uniref:STAS-like domain-containing protein n=1 Tax=Enterobacter hormaechei TaxID=158836 RepID=UPI00197DDB1D|nr:STAS-like domain-containing protein [Enterobacter hormaechei]ELE9244502.1 STAS-like domain-containing protein [Enterobacter kobei]MCU2631943.1 STAS-like domain-containing protein [Enterobacter hormaechei subsp. hoffmannii]MBN4832459.1 STAS-like domain-containing protein [Enterobacter hormaechei]MCU2747142.1 STAS-like domain-containing protein [Enterobacter hormaechei subsp. hoffmannii]MCU4113942.1 STAS-like domain-containing protein [Enterobacter hormaechei subsp. hoffmannii]